MAAPRLKNINGRFVENDFENALIAFLEAEGWQYVYGDDIPRANRKEVFYMDDLHRFLGKQHPNFSPPSSLSSTTLVRKCK